MSVNNGQQFERTNNNNNRTEMSQNFSVDRHENRVQTELPTYEDILREEEDIMPPLYDRVIQTNIVKV